MYQRSLLVVWLDILGHNLDIGQKRMVFLQKRMEPNIFTRARYSLSEFLILFLRIGDGSALYPTALISHRSARNIALSL